MMYQNIRNQNYSNDNRFLLPFILGGLAGGAAVGISRPRPIIAVPNPMPYPYQPYPYYRPY